MSEKGKLIVVLTRAIPVEGYFTDTLTKVCDDSDTIESVMEWAERYCGGSATMIRLEITRESP